MTHPKIISVSQEHAYLIPSIRQLQCAEVAHPQSVQQVTLVQHHQTHDHTGMPEVECEQRKQRVIPTTHLLQLWVLRQRPLLLLH
jgi:hypothetical protein